MWVARSSLLALAALVAAVCAQQQQQSMSALDSLQLLLDRPGEPVFYPKGDNGEVHFRIPPDKASEITDRFGQTAPRASVAPPRRPAAARRASAARRGGPLHGQRCVPVACSDARLPMSWAGAQHFHMFGIPYDRAPMPSGSCPSCSVRWPGRVRALTSRCHDSALLRPLRRLIR
ncbi:Protein of unknown function [Gryllus bimaculatus]|nr:Protein of unknown function [Gryllus bimaculatus]